jgi:hypothetical protein
MSSEIIQSVAYDKYDDFQHVNFIFKISFHYFEDYLMTKLTLGYGRLQLGYCSRKPPTLGHYSTQILQIEPSFKLKKYSLEMVPTLDMHNSNVQIQL